jgi:hypothetical protein
MSGAKQNEQTRQPVKPVGILDPNFKYVPAAATDVTQTWRRFGWTPIENKEKHYESST